MVTLYEQVLPEVWKATEANLESHFLSKQDWFQHVAGKSVFLPEPGPALSEFWSKVAAHELPVVQLQALSDMAPLLNKADALQKLQMDFELEQLKSKAATIITTCEGLKSQESVPISHLVKELETVVKDISLMAASQIKVRDGQADALKDSIKNYLTNHVMSAFMGVVQIVIAAAGEAESSIPGTYVQMVEIRDVHQIRNILFSRKVHEAVTVNLAAFICMGNCLTVICKCAGHLMTAPSLAKCKLFTNSLKSLRVYATTVQGLNLIINKFGATSQARNRAALAREPLERILYFLIFIVSVCQKV